MLNKKYKLYSSILALCMTLALMATGVWAILQQSVGVSTTVSFTATSVKGTINGEVEGGYAGVETDYEETALGGSDALTGAEIVQFGTKYVFANITGTNSSWNGKEAYYINGVTTEKVGEVVSSATLASAAKNYTVSNKSYVSNFSPTNPTTNWSIVDMAFQPNSEGQTSAITLTLTIKNTGSSVIAVSFPDDNNQWSDSMSEATAPDDNLLVSYAISNNGSAFSEPVAFSTINSKSIVSGGITTIKILVTVQDDSSSIPTINLAFQLKLEKGTEVWGGTVASSFAGGSGTELAPYEIETAEQLAYLASGTNDGSLTTKNKYFKQTQPIVLNNYAVFFDSTSNTVLVKNNTGTLCSLGLIGYYDMGVVKSGTIPNDLNAWTPIGNSTNKFQGVFDGNGYEISGIYTNVDLDETYGVYQGLFGYNSGATIQNVGVVNSYLVGYSVGGVVGYNDNSTISNSYNTGAIGGIEHVGGVNGGYNNATIEYCYNTGIVSADYSSIGGINGLNNYGTISDSYNTGSIVGSSSTGGVTGNNNFTIIENCHNTGTINGAENVGGLVGMTYNGTINNSYNSGSISGNSYFVGGIAGQSGSILSNCYNIGVVNGYSGVGGLAGFSNDEIANSYNIGTITGTSSVGGLVGDSNDSTVTNCYNTGTITGTEDYVGGVVGNAYYEGAVTNCYNTGTISGNSIVGGVIGFVGMVGDSYGIATVTNCYNNGTVNGTSSVGGVAGENDGKGIITNCYYLSTTATKAIGTNVGGIYTNLGSVTGPSANIVYIMDSDGITTNTSTTTLFQAMNAWVTANQTEMIYQSWQVVSGVNEGCPIFNVVPMGEAIATAFAVGTGTELDPYLISNENELIYLAYVTNSGMLETSGKYFELTNNIILNENSSSYETWDVSAPSNTWTAIGNQYYNFMGNFNGNDYTISGLYINKSLDYQGLFGYISGATVQNVGIINSYIKGLNNIGGISGFNWSSIITNCYNTGTISGTGGSVGGISGVNTYNCIITNCYNTGTINGNSYIGGIGGINRYNCIITNCYNTGTINGNSYIGGISGSDSGSITTNCYNTGNITCTGNYIGGISGADSGSITTNCYNTGTIIGGHRVGGVVGDHYGGNLTNCYNIGSVVSGGNMVGGVAGNIFNATINNCYYLDTTATNAIGRNQGTVSYTNLGSVPGPSDYIVYITDSDGTKNPSTTSLLIDALNIWVTANQTTPAYKTFIVGANGYPIFA